MNAKKRPESNQRKYPRIGVMIGEVNPYASLILEGLHAVAEEQKVDTFCFLGRDFSEDAIIRSTDNIIYQLISEQVIDGLIVLSAAVGQHISNLALAEILGSFAPLPIICVGEKIEGIPSLLVDNHTGLRDLLLHLIDVHGHKRLAFVQGPARNSDALERFQIYKSVLAEREIPLDPALVLPGGFRISDGEAATLELLRRNIPFDSICSADDEAAVGVLNALNSHGYHVPHDIAVTGFDDQPDSQYTLPPLTTVHQPVRSAGKRALQMLLEYLQSGDPPADQHLSTSVVIRQSCGCQSSLVVQIDKALATKISAPGTSEDDRETLFAHRQNIEQELFQILENIPHSTLFNYASRVLDLLDAFYVALSEEKSDLFLSALDKLLQLDVLNNQDLTAWQAVISEMRSLVQPYLTSEQMIVQTENLWQQARIFLSEMGQQAQARRRMQAMQQALTISQINQELITAFDFDRLMMAISSSLPQLDIDHALLFLFEPGDNGRESQFGELPSTARLILAYINGECIDLAPGGIPFSTVDFIPVGILSLNQRYDLLVMPLHFQSTLLGYAIIEMGKLDGFIYDSLEIQFSTAIQGALLIDQLRQSQTELEKRVEQRTAELRQEIGERIKAEKEVRENEQRYRALFDQTNDAIFILDLEGIHLAVNQQAADLLGYAVDELVGMPIKKIVAPDQLNDGERNFRALAAGKNLPIYERTFIHKNGSPVYVEINATLVVDPDGNPLHIQSIVRDITKRKRSERVFHALNAASMAMQLANTPDQTFVAAGEKLKELGLSSTIFLLDEERNRLITKYFSYSMKGVRAAEKLIGSKAQGFSFPVDAILSLQDTVQNKTTNFSSGTESHIRELFPGPLKSIAKHLVNLLNISRNINAPLVVEEKVVGVLTVQSDDLTEEDCSIITVFAHQLAAAWNKVNLMQELERSLAEQLRVEDALIQSEEKYRTLFELAPMPIVLLGLNGVILDVNQTATQLESVDKGSLIGRSFMDLEFFDEKDLPNYVEAFSSLVAGREIESFELHLQSIDGGSIRWIEVYPRLIKQDGETLAVLLILRDTTERKKALLALEKSEEQFRSIFENAIMGIYRSTPDGRIMMANPALIQMLGFGSLDAMIQRDLRTNGFATSHPRKEFLEKIESQGEVKGMESAWMRENGSILFIRENARAIRDGDGKTLYYEGTVEDITRRKRVERERQQLAELQNLMVSLSTKFINLGNTEIDAAIQQAIAMIGEHSEVDAVSLWWYAEDEKTASKRFGWWADGRTPVFTGNQNILIADYIEIFGPLNRFENIVIPSVSGLPSELSELQRALKKLRIESFIAVPLVSEGKTIGSLSYFMEFSIKEWTEETVNLMKIVGDIFVNALERKRAEESIRKLNEELEERVAQRTHQLQATNQELEAFAYSVSHDLRAPLRAIDGFSQALLEDYGEKFDREGQDFLHRVRAASQRMGQMIDDILQLSRATRTEMYYQDVHISEMARLIASDLRDLNPERKVEFVIQPNLIARGDTRLLRLVLENLLGNAWKFSSKKTKACIEFGLDTSDERQPFFIRDNGAGFNMDYADKLFDAFQRLHTPSEFEGTGIGLATVRRIIRRHGGDIWAIGEIDRGATFYFTLGEPINGKDQE